MANVKSNKGLNIALWVLQVLLGAFYGMVGVMKVSQPMQALNQMMFWTTHVEPWMVRGIGTLEILGAIGLILPSLTRIQPRLTPTAAVCFILLQIGAMAMHFSIGEINVLGLNVVLIAIATFIYWGRSRKSIVASRS